jgi:hypothetical protein
MRRRRRRGAAAWPACRTPSIPLLPALPPLPRRRRAAVRPVLRHGVDVAPRIRKHARPRAQAPLRPLRRLGRARVRRVRGRGGRRGGARGGGSAGGCCGAGAATAAPRAAARAARRVGRFLRRALAGTCNTGAALEREGRRCGRALAVTPRTGTRTPPHSPSTPHPPNLGGSPPAAVDGRCWSTARTGRRMVVRAGRGGPPAAAARHR